jgi:hypothetical protein
VKEESNWKYILGFMAVLTVIVALWVSLKLMNVDDPPEKRYP